MASPAGAGNIFATLFGRGQRGDAVAMHHIVDHQVQVLLVPAADYCYFVSAGEHVRIITQDLTLIDYQGVDGVYSVRVAGHPHGKINPGNAPATLTRVQVKEADLIERIAIAEFIIVLRNVDKNFAALAPVPIAG